MSRRTRGKKRKKKKVKRSAKRSSKTIDLGEGSTKQTEAFRAAVAKQMVKRGDKPGEGKHVIETEISEETDKRLRKTARKLGVSREEAAKIAVETSLDEYNRQHLPHLETEATKQAIETKLTSLEAEKLELENGLFRMPGPRYKKGKSVSKGRDFVIDLYIRTMNELRRSDLWGYDPGGSIEEERKQAQMANRVWGLLNQANIFEVPSSLYTQLYQTADVHACREAAGLGKLVRATEVTFPENLPFDVCYLALDAPVKLTDLQQAVYKVPNRSEGGLVIGAWLNGFLVSESESTSFVTIANTEDKSGLMIHGERMMGHWCSPDTLSPWIISWLIEWINGHQTTIEEHTGKFSYRRSYKKKAGRFATPSRIPKPYYSIYMKDKKVQEDWVKRLSRALKKRRKQEHRSEVRGHLVLRYMRGSLPLDPKLEKRLRRDKRRKVFTVTKPDPETAFELAKRGIAPKQINEWIAVLIYYRKDFIRGPEGAPLIPAIRKSAKYKEEQRKQRVANQ
jgi:hypothetical protein